MEGQVLLLTSEQASGAGGTGKQFSEYGVNFFWPREFCFGGNLKIHNDSLPLLQNIHVFIVRYAFWHISANAIEGTDLEEA